MKLNKIILPHPVLGQSDDVSGTCGIKENIEIKTTDHDYFIEFEIDHDNGTINDLVKFEKAIYCCEVSCAGTLYREIFVSTSKIFSFQIDRTVLKNKVEFQVFCSTIEDIPVYSNPASHNDYSGFQFELDYGDIVATFGTFGFNADIQYQKLKAASSFMQIIPNEGNKEYTEYVLDDSKIQIKLPQTLYDKYRQDSIGKRKEYSEIIHASFVQNALLIALFKFEAYLEQKVVWAESIKYRLMNEPELNNGSTHLDPDNIPTIVQKLLGNPNKRLIDRLEALAESYEDYNQD